MIINKTGKTIKKNKDSTKSSLHIKRIWLSVVTISVIIAIVVVILVVIFSNHSTKLLDAYNKCKSEFTAFEKEAEESNINRDDVVVYFKPDTSKESLESMASIMNSFGKVKKVTISTSEEEYEKLYQEYVSEGNQEMLTTLEIIGKDEMMKKMSAVMHIKAYDSGDLSSIKNVIENNGEFKKNIDKNKEPVYSKAPQINFGTMDLLDDGKTIVIEIGKGNYVDKMNCICSTLNMPDRIKDAIGQTVAVDGTRQDGWGDLNIEWSYRNDKLHIAIYQK